MYHLFHVSAKVALFTPDKTHVAVIWIEPINAYGLPGGHLEKGETPEEAMTREIHEECGIANVSATRSDFFTMPDGRVILAYAATLDEHAPIKCNQEVYEGTPLWLTREEFDALDIDENYRRHVVRHWDE